MHQVKGSERNASMARISWPPRMRTSCLALCCWRIHPLKIGSGIVRVRVSQRGANQSSAKIVSDCGPPLTKTLTRRWMHCGRWQLRGLANWLRPIGAGQTDVLEQSAIRKIACNCLVYRLAERLWVGHDRPIPMGWTPPHL